MIEETNVKDVYESISKHFSNTRAYTWDWVDKFIYSLTENSFILDVGCGNGRNMMYNNYKFLGIDNCQGFIDICRQKNLNVLQANMMNITLPNNTFDAIISIASFHHLSTAENRIKCLLELKRLIKKDGTILLSVWSISQPKKTRKEFTKYGDNLVSYNKFGNIYYRYYYLFKIQEIKELFIKSGFLLLHHEYNCGNEIFILKIN